MADNLTLFGRGKFGIHPTGCPQPPPLVFMPETGSAVVLARLRSNPATLRGYEVVPQNVRRVYWPPWVPWLGRIYVGSVHINSRFDQFGSSLCNTLDGQRIFAECRVEWRVTQPAHFLVRTRGLNLPMAMIQIISSAVQRFSSMHTSEEMITMPYQDLVNQQWRAAYAAATTNQPPTLQRFPRAIQQQALQQLDTLLANTPRMSGLESISQQCWNDLEAQLGNEFGITIRQTQIQNIGAPDIEDMIRGQRLLEIRQQVALAQVDALTQQLERFRGTDWLPAVMMLIEHLAISVMTNLPNMNFGGRVNR